MITFILIGINLVAFYLIRKGRLDSDNLAMSYYKVFHNREFYRLLTAAFTHVDLRHIAFNMISLYVVGSDIEAIFGPGRLLIIYFGSMIFGEMASLWMHHNIGEDYTMSIGASGAIFGLEGAYYMLIFFIFGISAIRNSLSSLAALFLMSIQPHVDGKTHLCCMIVGCIIAYLMIQLMILV